MITSNTSDPTKFAKNGGNLFAKKKITRKTTNRLQVSGLHVSSREPWWIAENRNRQKIEIHYFNLVRTYTKFSEKLTFHTP